MQCGEEMKLTELLSEKRPAILNRWLDVIVEAYHADTSIFLKNQKDQFANPIGYSLREGTEAILDALLSGADAEKRRLFLTVLYESGLFRKGLPPVLSYLFFS